MKNLLLSTALASGLFLGSCAQTGQISLPDLIAQVQQSTTQICSFVVDAATITALVNASLPQFKEYTTPAALIAAYAASICAQVVPAKKVGAEPEPTTAPNIGGIVIHGYFVDTKKAL